MKDLHNTPMTTSTGVKIGLAYHRQQFAELDRDARRLQSALLGVQHPGPDRSGIFIAAVVAIFIAYVLLSFWGAK